MNKVIDPYLLGAYAAKWRLQPDGAPFSTHSSVLLPATRNGHPVMLKLTSEPDEIRGGGLLAWWQGRAAVRVLEREKGALLMERATGSRSLAEMSCAGDDETATAILCSVASALHRPGDTPLPPLEPLETLFEPLLTSERDDRTVQTGRSLARDLLAGQTDCSPLHGDLQHHNVLETAQGNWVAIDPKGQYGDRTYDFVNLFRNPNAKIGNDAAVFSLRLSQVARHGNVDPQRLLRWIVAFCGLCLVWDYYPQGGPATDRELANLALTACSASS